MQPLKKHTGIVVPFERANIDTDAIVPKQFLKLIRKTGFGPHLFHEERYLANGEPDPAFILNQARYQGASILLAGANFGCGSSREHAVWAIRQYGFRVVIAPGFADIFFSNCFKNGLLAIQLPPDTCARLFDEARDPGTYSITVDLPAQTLTTSAVTRLGFDVNPSSKARLVGGLDEIAMSLRHAEEIRAFEAVRLGLAPWLTRTLNPEKEDVV